MIRLLCAGAAMLLVAAPAHAVDHSKGTPGFCPTGDGVTVVVDFQQLGGTTLVRCFPSTAPGTGLDALKGAGFQIAGVQRWGEAFVCRVENRPSAVEEVPIAGDEHYKEACLDTPPAAGYWSYWHAGNNCPWTYSQWGVKNREFVPGGFEGWSFSLNATAETNPVPRIAPVRPGTEARACGTADEPPPNSDDVEEKQRPKAQPATTAAPTTSAPSGSALPPPKPRTAPDPAANVEFDGGENAPDVVAVVKEQSGASDIAPWAAGGAVVLLAVAAYFTARRRTRR
ncbi:hypothetical protein GCM10022243_37100 [Saccharothrix violaceirubra]|uniref:ABC transporter substrate-binding protein n=1 Tax=Saccharothrix violaceirubra TaxID=413306 RepID=A0A7W7T704_9PSEU|nr:ABC transporter substrate-binding protein [Saccharothrix violaceirubra]MBB4966375.1 hypothetical protein [Saccharothrix violaceirubra]